MSALEQGLKTRLEKAGVVLENGGAYGSITFPALPDDELKTLRESLEKNGFLVLETDNPQQVQVTIPAPGMPAMLNSIHRPDQYANALRAAVDIIEKFNASAIEVASASNPSRDGGRLPRR